MNSMRCGFGANGLPYRSRHMVVLGFRMPRIVCACMRKVPETICSGGFR